MNQSASRILLLVLALGAATAYAAYEEIYNIQGSPVPPGLTQEQTQAAIITGGVRRGWVIEPVGPGHLLATLNVRRHTVRADIHFDTQTYSITYRDSENIKFRENKIHGAYNKWVRNLDGDIQRSLKLTSL